MVCPYLDEILGLLLFIAPRLAYHKDVAHNDKH